MNQVLALFVKSIRKISKRLRDIQKESVSAAMPAAADLPQRNDVGMLHTGAEIEEWPIMMQANAGITIAAVLDRPAATKPAATSAQGSATCR